MRGSSNRIQPPDFPDRRTHEIPIMYMGQMVQLARQAELPDSLRLEIWDGFRSHFKNNLLTNTCAKELHEKQIQFVERMILKFKNGQLPLPSEILELEHIQKELSKCVLELRIWY